MCSAQGDRRLLAWQSRTREWLRSQATVGYVGYDPAAGTFALAPGVAAVLGAGPLSGLAGGVAAQLGL